MVAAGVSTHINHMKLLALGTKLYRGFSMYCLYPALLLSKHVVAAETFFSAGLTTDVGFLQTALSTIL